MAAGCVMVTTEWSDWRNAAFWWIQSVYVVPEFRRCGVFGLCTRKKGAARCTDLVAPLLVFSQIDTKVRMSN